MGLFSWFKEKIEAAYDWVVDKLSRKHYDEDDVDDRVDVGATLEKFRTKIDDDVTALEKQCMNSISPLFSEMIEKTKGRFPDLIEIIENEQEKAEVELSGTIMKYVKEHLSENNSVFANVLKMNLGKTKKDALKDTKDRVFEEAEKMFYSKLKKYAEHVLEEFTSRLSIRIADQEGQMNQRIEELEKLQAEAEKGQIDVDILKEKCIPVMETAECIIHMFGVER